jgi:hypothetical protein
MAPGFGAYTLLSEPGAGMTEPMPPGVSLAVGGATGPLGATALLLGDGAVQAASMASARHHAGSRARRWGDG